MTDGVGDDFEKGFDPGSRAPADHDPIERFKVWLEDARRNEPNNHDAMALATASPDGRPSVRMVLLKGIGPEGFAFYTNLESRKGQEIAENQRAALCFYWKSIERQVRAEGPLTPVSGADADAYFASRRRGSRIGAWASDQSRPVSGRAELDRRVSEMTARFEGAEVPRPPHWSGFRLMPERLEFWREGNFRLHDRSVYFRTDGGWDVERQFP